MKQCRVLRASPRCFAGCFDTASLGVKGRGVSFLQKLYAKNKYICSFIPTLVLKIPTFYPILCQVSRLAIEPDLLIAQPVSLLLKSPQWNVVIGFVPFCEVTLFKSKYEISLRLYNYILIIKNEYLFIVIDRLFFQDY